MKVLIVTGGIGSGKSAVCGILSRRGIPVYDSDSRVKSLYLVHPELAAMVVPDIFSKPDALAALETALYPVLEKDFQEWAGERNCGLVAFESAVVLQKEYFSGFGDYVLYVDAPEELRKSRALARGGISEDSVQKRIALQKDEKDNPRVDCIIDNSGTLEYLEKQTDDFLKTIVMANEKTNLAKILSVSGYPGLYKFLAQSRTGAIAESLSTGARVNFPANGKITTLEDISIYTDEGEKKLRDVLVAMKETLGDAAAPTAKDADNVIREVFEKALPNYDRDRFYLSHMKKVVTWYNELKNHASLDFEVEE